jgi:proteasome lid subunit RPN8/RPN11
MTRADEPLAAVAPHLAGLAEAAPDREICGLVVAGADGVPEAWPVPNRAPDPSRGFVLGPEELLRALRRLDEEGGALLAVYHSHPAGGAELSARDLDGALAGGEPVLGGVAQVVVSLEGGRAATVRAHRWLGGRFQGADLWTSVRCPGRSSP